MMVESSRLAEPPYIDIMTTDISLDAVTRRAVSSLRIDNAVEPRTFGFGSGLARIRSDGDRSFLEVMGSPELTNVLGRTATWKRVTEKKTIEVFPPEAVVRNVLAEPNLAMPRIDRIVSAPVFAVDGSFDSTPGYQPTAGVFFAPPPGLEVPPIPTTPSAEDVGDALVLIYDDLLVDFPFADAASRAHALAGMLLPFARNMIEGPTPMHLIDAPARGSGKTLLAHVMALPSAGTTAVASEARSEEEWRKRVGSFLSTGPQVVLIDNLKKHLDSAALDAVLTSDIWVDRLLGRNDRQIRYPNKALWLATGNGVTLSVDLARRTIPISLDANMELPDTRPADSFRHRNLRAWALRSRGNLVWACAVLIRHWIAHGRPDGVTPPLGSFESWTATIGGILEVAHVDGFLIGHDEFRETFDPESASWVTFVDRWWNDHGDALVRAGKLADTYDMLDNDFLHIGASTARSRSTTLGHALLNRRNTIHGDYRIVLAGKKNQGGNRWRLEHITTSRTS